MEYDLIKKRAQDREDWRHWRPGLPEKAEHTRDSGRERKRERNLFSKCCVLIPDIPQCDEMLQT